MNNSIKQCIKTFDVIFDLNLKFDNINEKPPKIYQIPKCRHIPSK